jgi:hypothetical protein
MKIVFLSLFGNTDRTITITAQQHNSGTIAVLTDQFNHAFAGPICPKQKSRISTAPSF